ncbi:recombinase RecT [Devosia riboflavina]|uniref:recombinase RecT n=1 Tax=Devosia riboflavina TaxID=46914 RepID=UPI00068DEBA7|nr:recombinase RecT [Devosia riboflavina]
MTIDLTEHPTTDQAALPAPAQARNTLTRLSSEGGGIVFHTVAEARDIAYLMAGSDKAVRKHLRNNPGACFGIVIQAVEWGMSPYAVANKSYEVNDQLAYESQLIQAVILRRAPIKGRIRYRFEGEGNDRLCIASATTLEGEEVEYKSPKFSVITPKNSPLWKNDPDQQFCYYSGRALCRRHFPDVLLGIYDIDEMEGAQQMRDVTPPAGSGLAARLAASQSSTGFNADTVAAELAPQAQERKPEVSETVASPITDPSAVDWLNREYAIRAIKSGILPTGYSRGGAGELIVPADAGQHVNGHTAITALFSEIRSSSGAVLKTKNPPSDEQADPEVLRDATSTALSGAEREAPEGLNEAQTGFWLARYDEVLADAETNG